jgi:hypothetical protein
MVGTLISRTVLSLCQSPSVTTSTTHVSCTLVCSKPVEQTFQLFPGSSDKDGFVATASSTNSKCKYTVIYFKQTLGVSEYSVHAMVHLFLIKAFYDISLRQAE